MDATAWRGWPALQARWVTRIKRAALRQLHASAAGERLLLRMYLIGEEATEIALQRDLAGEPPPWLARQMEQHLSDERRHAAAFASALAERGGVSSPRAKPDALSRRKIAQWHRLASARSDRFANGLLVPAFAIGLCAEQMATRVLERHVAVIGQAHPLNVLLRSVLADEDRHVRLCCSTLARLVMPGEEAALQRLLNDVRRIDRAFGITGAVGMLIVGFALRLRTA